MKSREEIEKLVNALPYHKYGRVSLPFHLYTQGLDRSHTTRKIFPKSLQGKTLLDVGAAYGAVAFITEELGAQVTALEKKPDRAKRARLFAQLKESTVQFHVGDIDHTHIRQKFHYVLALNVLHHVRHPRRTTRHLLRLATEKVIIETPKHLRRPILHAARHKKVRTLHSPLPDRLIFIISV